MSKKKTSAYWKKRFEALETASNAYGQQTFRQIEPAFDKAQREIQNQIEAWYGRFAENNSITITEAKKLLTTKELKEFRWDVNEYIKYGRENDLNQLWMKELENASARVHVNRLEALKIKTQHAAEVAFGNEIDCIDAMARKVFTEDYYHTIFEVQKGFGIGWEIGQIDERKLKTLISKPWAADGKNFSERIWQQRSQLVDELHTQLTRTCVLGKAPDDAINAISKKFNTTKSQAGRLVMTEQAYFHSVAQKEAFNELDVEEFEIVATLDSSTSEICQEMDGKHFPMKDYEPTVTAPPFHVWCRSVTVPWFEDNYTGERAARDEDGQTYYVPDKMTYKDWKESLVDGNGEGLEPVKPKIDPYSFTEQQKEAIEWYVSGEGQYINQYYRGNVESDFGELSDVEKQMSSLLDEATDRTLPDGIEKLYRSVDASAVFGDMTDDDWYNLEQYINYGGDSFGKGAYADRIKQKAQNTLNKTKGKTITEKGFMSTTKDYDVAANWGDFTGAEKPIVLEFDVPKGVKGADLRDFDVEGDEQFEVLLARNTQYKVTNISSKDGQIYVKAELIPSEVVETVDKRITIKMGTLADESKLGAVHTEAMKTILEDAPPSVQKTWNKFSDRIDVEEAHSTKGAWCNYTKGITLDIDKVAKGERTISRITHDWEQAKKPYYTAFHEFGHNISSLMAKDATGYSFGDIADVFRSKKFLMESGSGYTLTGMLKKEGLDYFDSIFDKLKKEAKAAGLSVKTVRKQQAWNIIKEEILEKPIMHCTDISDLWDGISNGSCLAHYGHTNQKKTYWKEISVGTEGFAEMFSATVMNPDSVEQIKRYFPQSYELFLEIIEEMGVK